MRVFSLLSRRVSWSEVLCLARRVVDSAGETPGSVQVAMQNAHAVAYEMNGVASGDGRHRNVIDTPGEGPFAHALCFFEVEGLHQVIAREQVAVELFHGCAASHWQGVWGEKDAVLGDQGS